MSGQPLGVLAVLDNAASFYRSELETRRNPTPCEVAEMVAARARVAELIAAANETSEFFSERTIVHAKANALLSRLRFALAACTAARESQP